MSGWRLDEEKLLRLNTVLQQADDILVTNCLTRSAQESKLFPIMPYLDLVMIDCYYRTPDLLRKIAARTSPEQIGHRAREVSTTLTRLTTWAILNYYLNGRSLLIRHGLLRPQDNLEDLWFVADFQQRLIAAYQRANTHQSALAAGDITPHHEERTLQCFEADAFELDDRLRAAVGKFLAMATQYNFLIHCESRSGLAAAGPYRLGERTLLHTRDFLNMTECGLPWMDGIGTDLPYANLTVSLITDGVIFDITDWGTPYANPEAYQERIVGVGLYTSDALCDRYEPVGMGSAAELAGVFEELAQGCGIATRELYARFSDMTNDQMVEAGIACYLRAPVDAAIIAGVYAQDDWDWIDDRTRRLWTVYNEEYAMDAYVDYFAALQGRAGSDTDYYLHPVLYDRWRRNGGVDPVPGPGRNAQLVPGHVLNDHDYTLRVNPEGVSSSGTWSLPRKTGAYTFLEGRFGEAEMNERAHAFSSPLFEPPWDQLDERSIKWLWETPQADGLYRYAQERSRLLAARGAGLRRDDIDAIRRAAGERPWHEVAAERVAA
jgi:hypothetical protein